MDTPELDVSQLEAGRTFYEALDKLGFNPEGLFWAYDAQEEQFRLWLIWSGLDRYGPLSISKLLFKAYNKSALPREIDPFIVHVSSPEHMLGRLNKDMKVKDQYGKDMAAWRVLHKEIGVLHHVENKWVYHLEDRRFSSKKIDQQWRSFNKSVTALAA